MFLSGYINKNLEPIIDKFSIISTNEKIDVKAILDTGFNGACCLPKKYTEQFPFQPFGKIDYELANGQIISDITYIAEIMINNIPCFVEFTFTDSDTALVGMELIQGKIAIFDLIKLLFRVEN